MGYMLPNMYPVFNSSGRICMYDISNKIIINFDTFILDIRISGRSFDLPSVPKRTIIGIWISITKKYEKCNMKSYT